MIQYLDINSKIICWPFQAWIYHYHHHPLQAVNCCHNSQFVVDENVFKVGEKWKKILLFLKQFHENVCSKTTRFQEIKSVFRDVKWCFNASWGLNPFNPEFTIVISIHYKPQIAVAILDL